MDNELNDYVNRSTIDLKDTKTAFSFRGNEELRFSYLIFKMFKSPGLVNFFGNLALFALKIHLPIGWIVKRTIFRQFCGGASINDCENSIATLGNHNVGSILDYSVEAAQKESDFDKTKNELIHILEKSKGNPNIPFGCLKMTGLAKHSILEKVSAGEELSFSEKKLYLKGVQRLDEICEMAAKCDTHLFIDAEETWIQIAIDKLAESMMAKYNKSKPIVYTTLQMYRHDRLAYLKELIAKSKQHGYYTGIKFVRGAYLEKEHLRAQEKGYQTPINPNKQATDDAYNLALKTSVANLDFVWICAGTHNEKSSIYLTELMSEKQIPKSDQRIYFSQLYGMSDNISFVLAKNGYNTSKYLPYGPVRFTMPYLIRRAQENSAVAGQTSKELQLIEAEIKRRKS